MMNCRAPGSSPLLVPITSPSNVGSQSMLVSTDFPLRTAECMTVAQVANHCFKGSHKDVQELLRFSLIHGWLVPWKPSSNLYFLIILVRSPYRYAFSPAWSGGTLYQTHLPLVLGISSWQARMPIRFTEIVQRRQITALFNCFNSLFCNQGRCGKCLSSMNDSVSTAPTSSGS